MTNLILPSILVATVLLAGAFALMPVDEAKAVHTTIQGTQMTFTDVISGSSFVGDAATTCDSDADFTVFILVGGPAAANVLETVTVLFNTVTTVHTGTGFDSTTAGSPGFGGDGLSLTIYAEADDSVVVTGSAAVDYHVSMITTSGATASCET